MLCSMRQKGKSQQEKASPTRKFGTSWSVKSSRNLKWLKQYESDLAKECHQAA